MRILSVLLSIAMLFTLGCAQLPQRNGAQDMVVLIHGFGRSNFAMWKMQDRLEEAGYHVEAIGYSSLTQDMNGIVEEVAEQINALNTNDYAATHFVGHSLGGLLVRTYLANHTMENLGHVVMLGSPNKGTPIVDYLKDRWWFALAGPAVHAMSANGSAFLDNLQPPTYPLGVIAGDSENESHESILKGKDDGLVPLASTKVEGMRDFTVVDSGHSMLRYNVQAANETIYFLKHGRFKHSWPLALKHTL